METGIKRINFKTVSRLILTVFQRVKQEVELLFRSVGLVTYSKFDLFLSVFLFVTTKFRNSSTDNFRLSQPKGLLLFLY